MKLKSLNLTDFRSYSALDLEFPEKGAVIAGDNGSGKTNLLEALYFLAFGKSFRTSRDDELIRFEAPFFKVNAEFDLDQNTRTISAAVSKNNKIFKLNQAPLQRVSELFNLFKTVYFSPSDLEIILGSPAARRLFLDQAISQYNNSYLGELRNYRQILKQRNALLKSEFTAQEKQSWDEQFAQAAAKVTSQRLLYLNEFKPLIKKLYAEFIHQKESINLSYKFSYKCCAQDYSPQKFIQNLQQYQNQEKILQRTLFGPHLADLVFYINNLKARNFASQGQGRSLVIISRLAQALLIKKSDGILPLLMFDDVLSELDNSRAIAILKLIRENYQILIATPSQNEYKDLELNTIDLNEIL